MLASFLMIAFHASAVATAANSATHTDPPVQVSFSSNGDYHFGDRAKAYARTAKDGYLVVLRADVDGRVSAVFPVDPQDDQRVKGGKKYELKGRGGREAFVVGDTAGHGTVLAAYAATPFRFDKFANDGHWDTAALSGQGPKYAAAGTAATADPEARLRDLVRRMQPDQGHFDYDVATYVVAPPPRYVAGPDPGPYFYGWPGWWGWGYGWGSPFYVGPRVFVGRHFRRG